MVNNKKSLTPNQFIEQFYKENGIGTPVKPNLFCKQFKRKFGEAAESFMNCIDSRVKGLNADIYPLINENLEFANAIFTQWDSARIRSILVWFFQQEFQIKDKNILEVGCSNGIFLCCLAMAYPETVFLGIDRCEQAIKLARERVEFLQLKNIQFDIKTLDKSLSAKFEDKYEIIIASNVFHEVEKDDSLNEHKIKREVGRIFSIEDYDKSLATVDLSKPVLSFLLKALSINGRLISIDRLVDAFDTLKWIRTVESSGLSLNITESFLIQSKNEFGELVHFPLTVFNNKPNKSIARACDVLSFKSYLDYMNNKTLHVIDDINLAEMFYSALLKEELLFLECIYKNESGIEQYYAGVANSLGYIYQISNLGFRRISIIPSACIYEKIIEIVNVAEQKDTSADITVRWGKHELLSSLGIVPDNSLLKYESLA